MEHGSFGCGGGYVLVVDDDREVGDAIARSLRSRGLHAVAVDDFELAVRIVRGEPPAVIVLDQIVETPESEDFLRHCEQIGCGAVVVLLQFEPGPVGPFRRLHVAVLAGEGWFDELPEVVARHLYARAY